MLTKSQKTKRAKGIGGSDAAAVCGLNPWKTPYQVWREKFYGESDFVENEKTKLGNHLEPYVLDEYESETGVRLTRNIDTLRSLEHEFIIGHVDALDEENGIIVESKVTFNDSMWGSAESNDIPDYYLIQGAHYLNIMPHYKAVHFPVLFLTRYRVGVEIFKYTPNAELKANLLKKEISFWNNHVVAGVEPELTNRTDINKHYTSVTDDAVMADQNILQTFEELKKIRKDLEVVSAKKAMLETAVQKHIGAASKLVDANGMCLATFKVNKAKKRTFLVKS